DVAGAPSLQDIVIDPVAVEVAGEDSVAIALGPVVAQVNHGADVRVPAARHSVCTPAAARLGPVASPPMDVVGATFQQPVTVRVDVLAVHPLEVRAGDDVP